MLQRCCILPGLYPLPFLLMIPKISAYHLLTGYVYGHIMHVPLFTAPRGYTLHLVYILAFSTVCFKLYIS